MANYYVSSAAWTAVAQFTVSHAYTTGQYVRQLATPTFGNERVFKVTTPGTSASSEPAWNLGDGATTTSGGATFTQVAGREAEQAAGAWHAPLANILGWQNAFNAANANVFVSSDHAETTSGNLTYNMPTNTNIICVSRTGATIPPTSTDVTTGAQVITTVGANCNLTMVGLCYGVNFQCGSSTGTGAFIYTTRGSRGRLQKCIFGAMGTGGGNIQIGAGGVGSLIELIDCQVQFGSTASHLIINGLGPLDWKNNGVAMVAGTVFPNPLFAQGTADNMSGRFKGIDFSNLTNVIAATGSNSPTAAGPLDFEDCLWPNGVAGLVGLTINDASDFLFVNCPVGNNTTQYFHLHGSGSTIGYTDGYRSGGAADPNANFAWLFQKDGAGVNSFYRPYWSRIGEVPNPTFVSGSHTCTLYLCSSVALDNSQAWLEIETREGASPLGSVHTTQALPLTASPAALTTDTSSWGNGLTARANSHVYVLGARISATGSTLMFVCTGAGTSASSQPGGYASATDGSAVTDGTATFTAVFRYSITITWAPSNVGLIKWRVGLAPNGGQTTTFVYVDPAPVLA